MIMKIFVFGLLISCFTVSSACAVLPPDEIKKFEEAFLRQVNVQAEISFLNTSQEPMSNECTAVYTVQKVISIPEGLDFKEKDELLLRYSCDSGMRLSWMGSFYPWAEVKGKTIIAKLPGGYLSQEGRRWHISNENHAFSPILPAE